MPELIWLKDYLRLLKTGCLVLNILLNLLLALIARMTLYGHTWHKLLLKSAFMFISATLYRECEFFRIKPFFFTDLWWGIGHLIAVAVSFQSNFCGTFFVLNNKLGPSFAADQTRAVRYEMGPFESQTYRWRIRYTRSFFINPKLVLVVIIYVKLSRLKFEGCRRIAKGFRLIVLCKQSRWWRGRAEWRKASCRRKHMFNGR